MSGGPILRTLKARLRGTLASRPLARRIVLLSTLLVIGLHLGNALLVYHFYNSNAVREREAREATARLMAEHASRSFSAVDLSLAAIVDKLTAEASSKRPAIFTQALLEDYVGRLPQVRALIVTDENGNIAYDSRNFPPTAANVAGRAYFAEQRRWRGVGFYIGNLAQSMPRERAFFGLSRPLLDADGTFRGVVAALAEPGYFAGFYRKGELDPSVSAVLARGDGAILAGSADDMVGGASLTDFLSLHAREETLVLPVPSYPLQMVLAGPSPAVSPAFEAFLAADAGIILAMTVLALWLSRVLAREAEARSTAEARLRDAIESAPAGFALFDAGDRLVLCNDRYRLLYPPEWRNAVQPGASFAALARALLGAGGPGEDASEEREAALRRWLDAHRQGEGEAVEQLGDGSWLLTLERHTNEGGVVCFHTDITPMKRQEEAVRLSEQAERTARERAENADHAKSAFLATMSHELRTPLNAVIGFSEIIERQLFGKESARYREYGSLIRQSGQHLLAIINDILDVAKLQSGKTELQLAPTDLRCVIAASAQLVANQAEAGGLTLDVQVEPGLPFVVGDEIRLRQVLLNLLSNAIKFTPRGGRVSLLARADGEGVRMDVADTGIGIAPQDIPKALEPFAQISNALTRQHMGTGLGLPLTKSLVELHGARFEIKSRVGEGTQVSVIFPPASVAAAAPVLTASERANVA